MTISTGIHPTALISDSANLGKNVSVGPFSVIEDNVMIGDNTEIHAGVLVRPHTDIGQDCQIFTGAVLGEVPQDLKFEGEKTFLEIGSRTVIREYCTLNRGTSASGKTSIGNDVLLMAYVHVGHDCVVQDKVIIANACSLGGHVEVGYHAAVGGHCGVHQFCKIGDHAFIGGGFRIVQDVPPFILALGEPLKYGGLNVVGLRRRGFDSETRSIIKQAYKLIFRSGLNLTQAVKEIQSEFKPIPEIDKILDFAAASDRGLI